MPLLFSWHAWFPSRWKVSGPLSLAPRRRFHQWSFLHTVTFRRTFLGQFHYHLSRIHTVTLWHAYFWMKSTPGACRRKSAQHSLSARCAFGAWRPQFCPEGGRFFDQQMWHLARRVVGVKGFSTHCHLLPRIFRTRAELGSRGDTF